MIRSRNFALTVFLILLCGVLPTAASAQSGKQGATIFKQAKELENKARSRQDLEKAVEKYQEALGIFEKTRSEKWRGVTLVNIGMVYKSWGQYAKALEYYEKALQIHKKLGNIKGEGTTLNNIGAVYNSWGQYAKALEYYEKSLTITRKLGVGKLEGATLNNIGVVYSSWGQYRKALEYYEKSLVIRQKLGDVHGDGVTLNNIGEVYRSWGQYAKALEYYEKSLAIMQKSGDMKDEGGILNNISVVYEYLGQYPKALEYYEKSLAIRQKLGDVQGEGETLSGTGFVYSSLGQYPKALEYYEKSLAIMQKSGDVRSEGATLGYIGDVYNSWGQYPKALEYYQKSLAIRKQSGVPYVGTEDTIGNVYLSIGDMQRAEPLLKKANRAVSLGRLALIKSDFNGARVQYEKQLNRSLKNREFRGLFEGYTGLGLAYEGLNQYDWAAEHYKHAIEVTEQMRDSLTSTQRVDFYDAQIYHIPRITPYKGLARVLQKAGKSEQSLKESGGTKARAFAESLSRRAEDIPIDVPKEVIDRDADINNRLAALSQGLQKAYEKGSKDAVESFEKQVKEARQEKERHVSKVRSEYPLFAATKYPQPVGIEHSALKDNEWLLEYEVTEPGICIYLVHGKKIVKSLFKPVERKEIESLVRKSREPLEVAGKESVWDKLRSFDLVAGKKLSDLLLSDILPDLPKGAALIVVPDECLAVLPFEMLVLNSGGQVKTDGKVPIMAGAEFFGDRNPTSYYQSVTALTLARTLQTKRKAAERLLVMADPVFQLKDQRAQNAKPTKIAEADKKFYSDLMATMEDPQGGRLRFNRLPLTGELATTLSDLYKGQSDCYIGVDATKETLLKTVASKMDRYGAVVFATHGYFGNRIPGILEPILCLTMVPQGTDGFLRMSEVMGLKLNADIVALTACQTGLGRNVSGEGTMGMGRAFQYAGAKSVLMSLWNVEQKASVDLVQSFFRNLKQGKNKLEALRLARTEIRNSGYDHPFFWAPFILVGEID